MTPTDLPDLLHRHADEPSFRPVDLDAVVRSGTRMRRRRRAGVALAVASVVAVGAVGVQSLAGGRITEGRDVAPATGSSADRPLSWAAAGVLHIGDRTIRPAGGVGVYLEVGDAFAIVGSDRQVRLVDADGTARVISDGLPRLDPATTRLVTDGRWIAWSGAIDAGTATVYYYDTTTGRRLEEGVEIDPTRPDSSPLVSLDDGTAYLVDASGPILTTLPQDRGGTFAIHQIAEGLPGGEAFIDARGGSIARYRDGVEAGPSWDDVTPLEADGRPLLQSRGQLSPDGSAFAPDADTIRVVGLDGTDETPDVGSEYAFFSTVYQWLDDDTVAVIAASADDERFALLRCVLSTGTCRTEVPDLGAQRPFALPTGEALG